MNKKWSEEMILQKIKMKQKKLGKFNAHDDISLYYAARRYFGSWKKAKELAETIEAVEEEEEETVIILDGKKFDWKKSELEKIKLMRDQGMSESEIANEFYDADETSIYLCIMHVNEVGL